LRERDFIALVKSIRQAGAFRRNKRRSLHAGSIDVRGGLVFRAGSGDRNLGELHLRLAKPADFRAVARLYSQMGVASADLLSDLAVISKDPYSRLLVAARGSDLVAVMHYRLGTSLSKGLHLTIEDVIVDQHWRRLGIGTALVQVCLDEARGLGVDSVDLQCSRTQKGLHEFYSQMGFSHKMRHYSLFLESTSRRARLKRRPSSKRRET
jgi:GNAT superfamily N-acetyltransferase